MAEDTLLKEFQVPFTFKQRPFPIPADFRPLLRLSIVLLILKTCCRSRRATLQKLHVLNWAIRSQNTRTKFLKYIQGQFKPGDVIIRYEPVLNRVIDLALGEELVTRISGDKIQLTEKGIKLANEIELTDCLKEEKQFLNDIRRLVTETQLQKMIEMVIKS